MDNMEKTHELENKLTKVQTDVSYLKKQMNKVQNKLDSMDDKTDQLMNGLPNIFREIMETYVSRAEYDSFKDEIRKGLGGNASEHKVFDKRLDKIEIKLIGVAVVLATLMFILNNAQKIAQFFSDFAHTP